MIALTGMVVHNIEHDEDSGLMKSLDHILELKMLLGVKSSLKRSYLCLIVYC